MKWERMFFILILATLFSGWFKFLQIGLSLLTFGSYVIVLLLWLAINLILVIIGIHEMT